MEIIREVGRHGSVTAAAASLGVSQPAISMVLRDSAAAAGFPVFVRRQGRLWPTPETQYCMAELERVVSGFGRINQFVADLRQTNIGTVHVAATPTLADNIVPKAVAALQASRPAIHIRISSMDNRAVVAAVDAAEVDIGLVLAPVTNAALKVIELSSSNLVCIVHPGHALAQLPFVTPAQCAEYPLITFGPDLPLGALVQQSFRNAGVPFRGAIEVNQSSVACALARANAGVAILDPFWVVPGSPLGVVPIEFRPSVSVSAKALIPAGRTLARAARFFLACVRRVAAAELVRHTNGISAPR